MIGVLTRILSHASAKKEKTETVTGFKLLHFYWSFSSDIMAVKGLMFQTKTKKKKVDDLWQLISDVAPVEYLLYLFMSPCFTHTFSRLLSVG